MGKKRARQRKHLLFYLANCVIIPLLFWGCIHHPEKWKSEEHLARSKYYMSKGDYTMSQKESHTAYSLYPQLLGDEALFQIGMVYAHPANPEKDYQQSKEAFGRLLREYPLSHLEPEAEVWIMVLREIQELEKAMETNNNEISQIQNLLKKQRLQLKEIRHDYNRRLEAKEQTIKDLEQNLDRLKEVDLKIEEKKRRAKP